jgi:hypothetical protein
MEESINLFLSNNKWLLPLVLGLLIFWNIYPAIKKYFSPAMKKERKNKKDKIIEISDVEENNSKKESRIIIVLRIAFILIFIALPILWGVSSGVFNNNDSSYQEKTFYGYECKGDCSGHKAGYEWAENKNITEYDDCGGNSESFIEGCKSYVSGEYNFGNNE